MTPSFEMGYLAIHGLTTVGAVFVFLLRTEHRITKLEEGYKNLKDQHDVITCHGTVSHDD